MYSGNVKKAADEKKEEKKEDTPAPGEGDGEEGLSPFYYLHMLVYQDQIRENIINLPWLGNVKVVSVNEFLCNPD